MTLQKEFRRLLVLLGFLVAVDLAVALAQVRFPHPKPIYFPSESPSKCQLQGTSIPGVCTPIHDCHSVLKNYNQVLPTFCDKRDFTIYVCCPLSSAGNPQDIDVSPPPVNFACGATSVKPITQLIRESYVASMMASSSLAASASTFMNSNSPPYQSHATYPVPSGVSPSYSSRGSSNFFRPSQDRTSRFASLPSRFQPNNIVTPMVSNVTTSFQNSWPWMALLGSGSSSSPKWFCDGVLINNQWVLTAAHCVIKRFHRDATIIRLGEHDWTTPSEPPHRDYGVAATVFHPGYEFPKGYQDLALLQLDRVVSFGVEALPVCLPWGRQPSSLFGRVLTLTGWGASFFGGDLNSVLMESTLSVLDTRKCEEGYSRLADYSEKYPRGITLDLLCIGDTDGEGQDACQGNSGGPVVYQAGNRYILAGIVSRGYGCGLPNFPGLYASVHHAPDLAWIKRVAF